MLSGYSFHNSMRFCQEVKVLCFSLKLLVFTVLIVYVYCLHPCTK